MPKREPPYRFRPVPAVTPVDARCVGWLDANELEISARENMARFDRIPQTDKAYMLAGGDTGQVDRAIYQEVRIRQNWAK